jgi:hypothetical protein
MAPIKKVNRIRLEQHACCECNRRASHEVHVNATTSYYCCEHHIKRGGIPADWHPECQIFAIEQKKALDTE